MAQLDEKTELPLIKNSPLPATWPQPVSTLTGTLSHRLKSSPLILGLIGVAIFMALWQTATALQLLGPQFGPAFAPASAIIALIELTTSGVIWPHLHDSLRRIFVGLIIAAGIGIPVGVIIGYYRPAEALTAIVFQFLRMISPLAWMPIAIIIWGVGDKPIYFLIAVASVWSFIINTAHGVSRVNPLWIKVARNLGANELQLLSRVIFPAVIPDILTGLRLALGMAWVMLVPDEMLGVSSGLGYFILDTRDRFRYDQLMAAIMLIGLIGFVLDTIIKTIQRRYSWKTD